MPSAALYVVVFTFSRGFESSLRSQSLPGALLTPWISVTVFETVTPPAASLRLGIPHPATLDIHFSAHRRRIRFAEVSAPNWRWSLRSVKYSKQPRAALWGFWRDLFQDHRVRFELPQ